MLSVYYMEYCAVESHRWSVNIDSDNDLTLSSRQAIIKTNDYSAGR